MTRLYRLLLIAYPEPMRQAFGREMVELFADLLREEKRRRGFTAAVSVIVRTFLDLPFSASEARREELSTAHRREDLSGAHRPDDKSDGGAPGRLTAIPPTDPRDAGVRGFLDRLVHNLRYAGRGLLRSPGFACVVVFTLAVGIGANTVMFTVLDGVLLSPLPYERPERLVRLYTGSPNNPDAKEYIPGIAFLAYREQTDIFEDLAAAYSYRQSGADLTNGDETQRIVIMPASSGFFEVLGVEPIMGREFLLEEETGDTNVAVISYGLWHAAFAGEPDVLGTDIDLQGVPHTIVGVMPAGFRNPIGWDVDLWRPENLQPGGRNNWGNFYLSAIGRLRDDISLAEARTRLEALGVSMFEENPRTYGNYATIYPLLDDTVGDTRTMLWVLMGAVGMVLLIACVNVASLFLVRSADRWKELAIRAALGAGRRRLVGQMLTESLFLGIAGGVGGLALSFAGLRAVVALSPGSFPRIAELGIDTRIFVFATVVSVLTGLLFGVAPALQFSRPNLDRTLRGDDRGNSGGKTQRRLRAALVVAEVSIALVLLFGAGLLTKSFRQLVEVDLGVETGGVLTYEVHLPASRYPEARDRIAFYDRYFERVQTIAGVESVGATSYLPGEGRYHSWSLGRADLDLEDDESWTGTDVRVVDGDYLQLMGIELIRGRLFNSSDTFEVFENDRGAVLLNESLAERAFPDRDPLGAEVTFGGDDFRVVGIVSDTAHDPLGATSPKAYATHDQFAGDRNWAMIQTVRTSTDPASIVGQLRGSLREVDSQLVLYKVRTMDEVVAHGISPQRFSMALMTGFAAIALLLAAVGIYGVLSYTVAQRTHEIGIRMALGADRSTVRAMIMRQALAITGLGVILGVAGALAIAGWLSSMLFEVQPQDPTVLAAVALALGVVATIAGYLPARRATSVDPMLALRKQ